MGTLAEKILALNDGIRTDREIAEAVYGKPAPDKRLAYVRVGLRQRKGTSQSEHDRRYIGSPLGRAMAARLAPAKQAYKAVLQLTMDIEKARSDGRRAYRRAKKEGRSDLEATRLYQKAYDKVLYGTGDIELAKKAYRSARLSGSSASP